MVLDLILKLSLKALGKLVGIGLDMLPKIKPMIKEIMEIIARSISVAYITNKDT